MSFKMDRPASQTTQSPRGFHAATGSPPVEWKVEPGLTDYRHALTLMEQRAGAIRDGSAGEMVWLVQHAPLYTAGTSAKPDGLLDAGRFPVHAAGRGGEYTYHGPGQRVAYVMLDLRRRREDVRAFVMALEDWIVGALAAFGVVGERRSDRVGVWVRRTDLPPLPGGIVAEDKIAAIGIRLKRWVSFHGIAVNVAPDLEHFSGIIPCGISGHGVTSLADLGRRATLAEFDIALRSAFEEVFGPVMEADMEKFGKSA